MRALRGGRKGELFEVSLILGVRGLSWHSGAGAWQPWLGGLLKAVKMKLDSISLSLSE